MKVCILVGTRPEIIKMAPVVKACIDQNLPYVFVHSNQHYSYSLDQIFFEELGLPKPHYNLDCGSGTHANQTAKILMGIEPILLSEKPDVILVQGDTNTVLAGALAASKLGIKVGHVEAGLRSYDRTMPEELNRIAADHVSDFLFAVTDVQVEILKKEGIPQEKIFKVGNTIVDSIYQNKNKAKEKSQILSKLNIKPKEFYLFTAHRATNVDTKDSVLELFDILNTMKLPVVWPIHLRTEKQIAQYGLTLPSHVLKTEPLGYFDFLTLLQDAKAVVTDSGGVQEEACILGTPAITIRDSTERPETVEVGANVLVHRDLNKLKNALNQLPAKFHNPFGDGKTSEKILEIIQKPEAKAALKN